MTYVLPMAMDDLDTLKGIIVFWNSDGNVIYAYVENESVLSKSGTDSTGI